MAFRKCAFQTNEALKWLRFLFMKFNPSCEVSGIVCYLFPRDKAQAHMFSDPNMAMKKNPFDNYSSDAHFCMVQLLLLWENSVLHVPQRTRHTLRFFSDPNMALSMIIPQTLTFAWVNFFFSGFVLLEKWTYKVTLNGKELESIAYENLKCMRNNHESYIFKSLKFIPSSGVSENGIDLITIDVSYVSSRS
ncbi:unnamed protein product [Thlaspi arvense]|uniref:Uncharacterized protein n=1 Tax=Thlaspi arvense TaxID=13288 RepID=A0AAU9R8B8_THLAR|nr:unnamed protein product [Thlaspi arvense]